MWDCCGPFVAAIVLAIIVAIIQDKKEKEQKKENKSANSQYVYKKDEKPGVLGGTNLDRFFIECVLAEYDDFTKEKNLAKAKLLADKYNLAYPNGIEALYQQGLKAHEKISNKISDSKLEKKRAAEKEEFDRLNRYADCYGKSKKVSMLQDRKEELLQEAKSLDLGAKTLMKSVYQPERDWATWGGIANGIAGAGAGISTAMEIQAQNAEIRAQNEVNMRAAMPAYMSVTGNAAKNRANADAIQKQIDNMAEKLISDMPTNDVMNLLDIINETIDVSETGAFKITATVVAKEKLTIYDDVAACADGTIIAHVFDKNVEVGTAKMVLPVNGVVNKTGIVGIGLSGAKPEKNYTVKFTAHHLWLMEV